MRENQAPTAYSELGDLMTQALGMIVISDEEAKEIEENDRLKRIELSRQRKISAGFSEEFIDAKKYRYCCKIEGDVTYHEKQYTIRNNMIGGLLYENFVMLRGKSGRGKSHILYAIAMNFFRRGRDIYIIDEERDLKSKSYSELRIFFNKLYRKKYIFIDDVGFAKLGEETRDLMKVFLAFRIKNNLSTYFTTNLSMTNLFGANMASRIQGRFIVIDMNREIDRRITNT